MEAARSAYGPSAQRAAELPDGGHDPTFLDRTAPLLEFLWSRYFRVRLLGIENVPATGAAMLVGNHSGIEFWRSVGFAEYYLTLEPAT